MNSSELNACWTKYGSVLFLGTTVPPFRKCEYETLDPYLETWHVDAVDIPKNSCLYDAVSAAVVGWDSGRPY